MTTLPKEASEAGARAICRQRILDNAARDDAARDPDFLQRAEDHAWPAYVVDAEAAILAALPHIRDDVAVSIAACRAMFPSDGDEEGRFVDHMKHACPYCGGSGHKDDVKAPPAPSVAAGWKLAPIEPTPEMINATGFLRSAYSIYTTMLAAAPEPPPASAPASPDSSPASDDPNLTDAEIDELVKECGRPEDVFPYVVPPADPLIEQMAAALAPFAFMDHEYVGVLDGDIIYIEMEDGEVIAERNAAEFRCANSAYDAYKARKAGTNG